MASMNDLPNEVLLEISLLPMPDRVRNARVCQRWNSLLQDHLMWQHADLPLQELFGLSSWDFDQVQVRLRDFWQDVPSDIGSSLQSLRLRGYRVGNTLLDLSREFFEALGRKCPHLQCLSVHTADLTLVPLASLPRSLRRLEIHSCDITFYGLPQNEAEGVLPHLEQLVLDHLPSFQDHHLQRLKCFPGLRSLVVAGIDDLNETRLTTGLMEVSCLHSIEVLGCAVSADDALRAIRLHLPEVRKIGLTVNGLSDIGLESLERIRTLESLSLLSLADTSEVHTLTEQLLSSCSTLPRLRVLKLQGQGWEGQETETRC